jgi:hypothetical protein
MNMLTRRNGIHLLLIALFTLGVILIPSLGAIHSDRHSRRSRAARWRQGSLHPAV